MDQPSIFNGVFVIYGIKLCVKGHFFSAVRAERRFSGVQPVGFPTDFIAFSKDFSVVWGSKRKIDIFFLSGAEELFFLKYAGQGPSPYGMMPEHHIR